MTRLTRFAAAAVVAAHGAIHLIGFVVPWDLASVEGFPYDTAVLGGAVDLGDLGVRVVGLAWLACAVGFVVAAAGIVRRSSWALPLTRTFAALSLALCVLALPATVAGIVVNAAILGGVAWVSRSRSRSPESEVQ